MRLKTQVPLLVCCSPSWRSTEEVIWPIFIIHYRIVAHDDGWAYKAGDVFSECYATHEEAREAAERAAAEQRCRVRLKTSSISGTYLIARRYLSVPFEAPKNCIEQFLGL
jgi:hypothetical protein